MIKYTTAVRFGTADTEANLQRFTRASPDSVPCYIRSVL
jgi:hypothetical protein